MYSGRLRTPEQIKAVREYQRDYARKNPEKKHAWRKAHPDLAKVSARTSMRKLRAKRGPDAVAAIARKHRGLPTPTRPEPKICELCEKQSLKRLHLDHDHSSGKFRGWLCDTCNRGLGYFKDSPQLLRKAAIYLEIKR